MISWTDEQLLLFLTIRGFEQMELQDHEQVSPGLSHLEDKDKGLQIRPFQELAKIFYQLIDEIYSEDQGCHHAELLGHFVVLLVGNPMNRRNFAHRFRTVRCKDKRLWNYTIPKVKYLDIQLVPHKSTKLYHNLSLKPPEVNTDTLSFCQYEDSSEKRTWV